MFTLIEDPNVAGEDADFFTVDPATGEISIPNAIENRPSADGNFVYEFEVQVTDGEFTDTVLVEYLIAGGA